MRNDRLISAIEAGRAQKVEEERKRLAYEKDLLVRQAKAEKERRQRALKWVRAREDKIYELITDAERLGRRNFPVENIAFDQDLPFPARLIAELVREVVPGTWYFTTYGKQLRYVIEWGR